jgi:hypothetical protein
MTPTPSPSTQAPEGSNPTVTPTAPAIAEEVRAPAVAIDEQAKEPGPIASETLHEAEPPLTGVAAEAALQQGSIDALLEALKGLEEADRKTIAPYLAKALIHHIFAPLSPDFPRGRGRDR